MSDRKLGLTFRETMAGGLSLEETDPVTGDHKGKHTGTILSMHASIAIDDLDRFLGDPNHTGQITGSIDYPPFGENIPAKGGVFNLFSPTDNPKLKLMVYEMAFEHAGQEYYLAGEKHVRSDHPLELWKDTTTLFSKLHKGADKLAPVTGAGVLSLGPIDLIKMISTMHPLNASNLAEGTAAVSRFGRFFLGELWETYVRKS